MTTIAVRKAVGSSCALRCIALFIALASLVSVGYGADKPASVADGELQGCQFVTIDTIWAVGDRGLILYSSDGGKRWEVQQPRSDATLYAVCFSNDQNGCVLGGTIEPYSHRSTATIQITSDGGKSWQSIANSLPRLIGAQLIGNGHILAWGDWSNLHQSALFESLDGGHTWAGRPIPCSHLQCAATSPDGTTIVVDRMGKSYRSQNGLEFDAVALPVSPFEPFRFCKWIDGVWWLGGDAGKLFRSRDGKQWIESILPGTSADHALVSLRTIAGQGNRVWTAGYPGNLVWMSEDSGKTWTTKPTTNGTVIHSLSVLQSDLLISCGGMASVFASRNGGKAWWPQHQSGTRSAVLNISATCTGVAWDLMTQVMHEYKRHASTLVLHDQCFEERTGLLPELSARFEAAGKSIGLAQARMLASFPVGNLESGFRSTDLGYYAEFATNGSKATSITPLVHQLVFEIRNSRPDLIVTNCSATGNSLEVKAAGAVERAVTLAADKNFRLYSDGSGIPDEAWETKRILVRSASAVNQYSPSMLLDTSLVLGSALIHVKPLIQGNGIEFPADKRFAYRLASNRSGIMRDPPLQGIVLDASTQIADRLEFCQPKAILRRTSTWFGWKQLIETESGNPLTPDRVWDSKLRNAAKDVAESSVPPVLLDIAVQARRSGDWNRWQAALDFLLEKDRESAASEAAYWELMRHTGSVEVKRMLLNQLQSLEQRKADGLAVSATALQQASPFSRAQSESTVQKAAYNNSVMLIPIATHRDFNEFTRLLGKWPDSFVSRRTDPRWAWLIASRYRGLQLRNESVNATVNLGRSYSDYWPQLSPCPADWSRVAKAEKDFLNQISAPPALSAPSAPVVNSTGQSSTLPILTFTTEAPSLDGKATEPFWQNATRVLLRDPWSTNTTHSTSIRIARDSQFLYVLSEARIVGQSGPEIEKRREVPKAEVDQIKIRFDLDRDYASWFEIGWTIAGDKLDAVNDMQQWNPSWTIATFQDGQTWNAEIAIPLEQLVIPNELTAKDWGKEVWALQFFRVIPGVAAHSVAPALSDQPAADDWILLNLGPQ